MPNPETYNIPGSNFSFSAVRPDTLTNVKYSLVTLVIDRSYSTVDFKDKLLESLKIALKACQKSPMSENIMVRILLFDSNITELHGFKLLNEINVDDDYKDIEIGSNTALYDATFDAVGSTLRYARILRDQEFEVNGIVFITTDGGDNESSHSPASIKKSVHDALQSESIESIITVLVGINTTQEYRDAQEKFVKDAELTQYIDMGDVTAQKLAKFAQFVSKSTSSVSKSLGTKQSINKELLTF